MKIKKLTEFDYHELLDRVSLTIDSINTHMINHPASTSNKEIKDKLENASDKLSEAYQMIGEKY
jgi:hypothetical protein